MKRLLLLFSATLLLTACGSAIASPVSESGAAADKVYVCTGGSSKKYHATANCTGLKSCKGRIVEMSKAEAEKLGRTPCKICKPE